MKKFSTISLILLGVFAFVFIIIHFLRPDLYFLRYPISRYAIGNYRDLMNLGFLSFGLSEVLTGVAIYKLHRSPSMISILSILCGIGSIMVSVFYTDVGNESTTRGFLHFIGASLQFVLFPIMCFFAQRRYHLTGIFREFTLFISILLILFIPFMEICFYFRSWTVFTIIEKTNIVIFIIWLFVIQRKLSAGTIIDKNSLPKN